MMSKRLQRRSVEQESAHFEESALELVLDGMWLNRDAAIGDHVNSRTSRMLVRHLQNDVIVVHARHLEHAFAHVLRASTQ